MELWAPQNVLLLDEGSSPALKLQKIENYLKTFGFLVKQQGNPFFYLEKEQISQLATQFANCKVIDINHPWQAPLPPLPAEIQFEEKRITSQSTSFGILYDGIRFQRTFAEFLLKKGFTIENVTLIFTNRLLATWDSGDKRYHARVAVYGFPSIISTTGVVEAPAKPKEFYLLKQQYEITGKDIYELKEQFKGRFIDYDDENLTEVIKGYVMQALFYWLIGDPFCQDINCRLYNAHRQEEMIQAQLTSPYEFCPFHQEIIEKRVKKGTTK